MSRGKPTLRAYQVRVVEPDEAKPQLLTMLGNAVQIVENGLLQTADAEGPLTLPVAQVSTAKRRDIRDLPRVHATDGDGEALCQWTFPVAKDLRWAFLSVKLTKPARCSFVLTFNMDTQTRLLREIAKTESLLVATVPPDSQDVLRQSILIHPPGAELRLMLDSLKVLRLIQ